MAIYFRSSSLALGATVVVPASPSTASVVWCTSRALATHDVLGLTRPVRVCSKSQIIAKRSAKSPPSFASVVLHFLLSNSFRVYRSSFPPSYSVGGGVKQAPWMTFSRSSFYRTDPIESQIHGSSPSPWSKTKLFQPDSTTAARLISSMAIYVCRWRR